MEERERERLKEISGPFREISPFVCPRAKGEVRLAVREVRERNRTMNNENQAQFNLKHSRQFLPNLPPSLTLSGDQVTPVAT